MNNYKGPSKMKSIIYNEFGGIDVLQTTELPMPIIKANQALISVKSVAINPLDWKIRKAK